MPIELTDTHLEDTFRNNFKRTILVNVLVIDGLENIDRIGLKYRLEDLKGNPMNDWRTLYIKSGRQTVDERLFDFGEEIPRSRQAFYIRFRAEPDDKSLTFHIQINLDLVLDTA